MAACDHYGLNAEQRRPLESLSVVEVGCGGGILSETLAAMGAKVTAIDAAEESIEVAREVRQNQLLSSFVRAGIAYLRQADFFFFNREAPEAQHGGPRRQAVLCGDDGGGPGVREQAIRRGRKLGGC